jgi:hypothetical protein
MKMLFGDTSPVLYAYPPQRPVARGKTAKKQSRPKAEPRSKKPAAPTVIDVMAWRIAGMPTDYGQG